MSNTPTMTFSDYRGTIQALYAAIAKDIKDIFAKHEGKTETNSTGECNCFNIPVIQDSDTDDGIYTLDRIGISKKGKVYMEASNSYDCDTFSADDVPLEVLLDVLETLQEYEDELFKDLEEEDNEEEDIDEIEV